MSIPSDSESKKDKSYFKVNASFTSDVFLCIYHRFKSEVGNVDCAPQPRYPKGLDEDNEGVFDMFVESIAKMVTLVYGMTVSLGMTLLRVGDKNSVVKSPEAYFLYLAEDSAHGWKATASSVCEAWIVLSAITQGVVAGPALRPTDTGIDAIVFGPVFLDVGCQSADSLDGQTLASLTVDTLLRRREAGGPEVNIDVKFHNLGNSIDEIVASITKELQKDNEEYIMCNGVFQAHVQKKISKAAMQKVIWCYPMYYDWLRSVVGGTITGNLSFRDVVFDDNEEEEVAVEKAPETVFVAPAAEVEAPATETETETEVEVEVEVQAEVEKEEEEAAPAAEETEEVAELAEATAEVTVSDE